MPCTSNTRATPATLTIRAIVRSNIRTLRAPAWLVAKHKTMMISQAKVENKGGHNRDVPKVLHSYNRFLQLSYICLAHWFCNSSSRERVCRSSNSCLRSLSMDALSTIGARTIPAPLEPTHKAVDMEDGATAKDGYIGKSFHANATCVGISRSLSVHPNNSSCIRIYMGPLNPFSCVMKSSPCTHGRICNDFSKSGNMSSGMGLPQ